MPCLRRALTSRRQAHKLQKQADTENYNITTETRRESYQAIQPVAQRRRELILEVLGSKEMTATEIAEQLYIRGDTPYYERNIRYSVYG
jgi:DNA-directed RNA polymerase specialized sigma subunit